MQEVLNNLVQQRTLSKSEAEETIYDITSDKLSKEEICGLMVALQTRNITIPEVEGFRKALLQLSVKPKIDGKNAIDLCGTGGDGKNTFNISTTTAFVLASMGYRVIKHGNYGVSSLCGSSNVLEELGITFSNDSETLNQQLNSFNLCFLHAPLFHPAMKKVAQIRKGIGIPTFFNIMGPLVNPVQPEYQLTGTFSLGVARIYHHILKNHRTNYKVIYGLDGYDEISLTDETRIFGSNEDVLFHPKNIGIEKINPSEIIGGNSIKEAVFILKQILSGNGTNSQNNVIACNAAHAIQTMDSDRSLKSSYNEVLDHLLTGKTNDLLEKIIKN